LELVIGTAVIVPHLHEKGYICSLLGKTFSSRWIGKRGGRAVLISLVFLIASRILGCHHQKLRWRQVFLSLSLVES